MKKEVVKHIYIVCNNYIGSQTHEVYYKMQHNAFLSFFKLILKLEKQIQTGHKREENVFSSKTVQEEAVVFTLKIPAQLVAT